MSKAKLNEIEAEMKALSDNGGDTEADHSRADDLLITLARALATETNVAQVERIVSQYEKIDKWYA